MRRSFGEYLYEFAESVDNVSEAIFKKVMDDAVGKYLEKSFSLASAGFLVESKVNGRPGLSVEWRLNGGKWSNSLFNRDIDFAGLSALRDSNNPLPKEAYIGQVSFAFVKGKPLWIVPKNKEEYLHDTDAYLELWNRTSSTSIPTFVHNHNQPVKSVIILPLFRKARQGEAPPFGVLNLESEKYLEPTKDSKQEVEKISEAISILYDLKIIQVMQQQGTNDVVAEIVKGSQRPFVSEPRVFIASAKSRKSDVIALINNALQNSFNDLDIHSPKIIDWKETNSPASHILSEIWEEMRSSHLGICYFSEPCPSVQESSSVKFKDNANVLFEAGLMDALTKLNDSIPDSRFNGWVLVRETDSPEIMSDLNAFKRVDIKRYDDEILNRDEMENTIKEFIKKIYDFRFV